MCGICGVLDYSARIDTQELTLRMTASLDHRGPDHSGTYCDRQIGLGHTRLSILDLTENGHQPMATEDGRYIISYNGEVYNFPELRRRLEGEGVRFRSRSDTEVVLHCFARWGVECFALFKGMFALAIWDSRTSRLILARDRFGIKPLYYLVHRGRLLFGSEIKAILQDREVQRELNPASLHEYVYFNSSLGEKTFFCGIHKLLPGHYLIREKEGQQIRSFVGEVFARPVRSDYSKEQMWTKLNEAIGRHLIADVPVGVFLSGGMDSSTITAIAARQYPGQLKTYSIGFDCQKDGGELPRARQVAQAFGTDHHEVILESSQIPAVIERLVASHDEPFGDAADIPLYLLCQNIRGQMKVVLQGDGGDEIFAGYRRYQVLSQERWWRLLARAGNLGLPLLPESPLSHRLQRFFQAVADPDPAMRMALLLTVEALHNSPLALFSRAMAEEMRRFDPFARYRQMYQSFASLDPVQRMLFTDCQIQLPDLYLPKVDKSTMAHGIEVRIPLLDNDLSDYLMGMPARQKIRYGIGKWTLRHTMKEHLPKEIVSGRKMGFGVPMGWWLRNGLTDYMKNVLLDPSITRRGIFDRTALENCIAQHLDGRKENGFLLYRVLNFCLWVDRYLK